jgi:hypothetical protein
MTRTALGLVVIGAGGPFAAAPLGGKENTPPGEAGCRGSVILKGLADLGA